MKIAFVGKGGTGKSTLATLFIQHLVSQSQIVLAIDADINMHVAQLLGITINHQLALSSDTNKQHIRSFLKGNNPRIKSAEHMVKTTPPGTGSNLITYDQNNEIIKTFSLPFNQNARYMYVGTYQSEEIGTACYHTNLSIFENLLSHTILRDQEWLVADMVAGTDAFSNTLHAQFDKIVLVIEPTPEGVSVFKQYTALASQAGVSDSIIVIGNKVDGSDDLAYLQDKLGNQLFGHFKSNSQIKKARQADQAVQTTMLDQQEIAVFEHIQKITISQAIPSDQKLKRLHNLHQKYVKQDYIINALGDISAQIDLNFRYPY